MESNELIKELESMLYSNVKELPGRGLCGIMPMAFTTGLCYGMDLSGLEGRYCFEHRSEAIQALATWDGTGDPSGNWIKHKGYTEYRNLNYLKVKTGCGEIILFPYERFHKFLEAVSAAAIAGEDEFEFDGHRWTCTWAEFLMDMVNETRFNVMVEAKYQSSKSV